MCDDDGDPGAVESATANVGLDPSHRVLPNLAEIVADDLEWFLVQGAQSLSRLVHEAELNGAVREIFFVEQQQLEPLNGWGVGRDRIAVRNFLSMWCAAVAVLYCRGDLWAVCIAIGGIFPAGDHLDILGLGGDSPCDTREGSSKVDADDEFRFTGHCRGV